MVKVVVVEVERVFRSDAHKPDGGSLSLITSSIFGNIPKQIP